MRAVTLLALLCAASVDVFPESSIASANRTTDFRPTLPVPAKQLLSQEQVAGWVARWQQRLGLQEWKIEARIVRLSALPKGTVANIHWSLSRRQATIKVLDSIDSTLPQSEIVKDTELSVVHELVHLSMAKLPLDGENTDLEEEAVKKISTALVALHKEEEDRLAARVQ